MQKEMKIGDIAFGEMFTYKGVDYNKVALKSESRITDEGFIFGISGLKLLALHWTTMVMVDIPSVKLSEVKFGQKFKFGSTVYTKVECNLGKYGNDAIYALRDNKVDWFSSGNIDVELID